MAIVIDKEKCAGCGACLESCPFAAIELDGYTAEISNKCTECGACIESCPFEAISQTGKMENETACLDEFRGVWVFAEQRQGKIMNIAFELLGEGRKLADQLGVELGAVLIGNEIEAKAAELVNYGADLVYVIEDPQLRDYRTEAYCAAMEKAVKTYKPEIVLIGATNIGRDLGPRVAGRIRTGLQIAQSWQ